MGSIAWGDLMEAAGDTSTTFDLIPDGVYAVKILKAETGMTGSGKKKITVTTQITEGKWANRRIWDDITLTEDNPKAMGFFFRKMAAMGLNKDYFARGPELSDVATALTNRTFRAQIYTDDYLGNKKNKIKNYLPAQGGRTDIPVPAPTNPTQPVPGPNSPNSPTPQNVAPPAPPAPPAPAPAQQATPSPWEATAGAPPAPPF